MKRSYEKKRRSKKLPSFIWIFFGIIFIAGASMALTQVSDTGIITPSLTTSSGTVSFDQIGYGQTQGTLLDTEPYRKIVSNQAVTMTVCPSGCAYSTLQSAIDQVPLILRHRYTINVNNLNSSENIFIPAIITSGIVDSVDGACEALRIVGNDNSSINSIQISASIGCQTPAISHIKMKGYDPYSDENVSISIYGSSHPIIKYVNFTGVSANYGIMSYGSSVTLSGNNFGSNNLQTALLVKHGGIISFNDDPNYGNVTGSLVRLDDGVVYLNNDTLRMNWTGNMYSYPDDHSGITMSNVCNWEGNITRGSICSNNRIMKGVNTTSQMVYCC